jgi:hypothetical protein
MPQMTHSKLKAIAKAPLKNGFKRDDRFGAAVAFVPPYLDTRMTIQRSRFTIHGFKCSDLEEQVGTTNADEGALQKYLLDRERCDHMLNELRYFGISRETVYPDLEGLVVGIRASMGYRLG